ncbi:MAG: aquaporin [Candidatus Gastranaerophilales bacterium]|nr:aquaporin [Candidatus Gastranaerophilales bacterium]
MIENLKKYLVELIGTFFLVFTIVAVSYYAQGILSPFAIAAVLTVMIYAGGYISGGHYNPAVSLAAAIRGALSWKQFAPYAAAQVVGGVIAVYLFKFITCANAYTLQVSDFGLKKLLIAEFLFTFALCYVVLQTATTKQTNGNSYYGLAIGLTVFAGAISVGGILCAGAFNPAVAISLGLFKSISWAAAGYTILANLVAGAVAALIFKLTYPCEKD